MTCFCFTYSEKLSDRTPSSLQHSRPTGIYRNSNDDTSTTTPTKVRRVRLLCKENLIPFYERYGGFALEGASAVEHGAETWFDMVLDLA